MVALIGASPTVARLLRSLCYGLGIARPEGVFPALRRRTPRAARRSRGEARMDVDGGIRLGGASRLREPSAVMSPQARERWWAERGGGGGSVGASTGAGDATRARDARDSPARGRWAKG